MAVSNKNISMLPGWRKPLSGGPTHFVILVSQFSSATTIPQVSKVYISMKGGGIGITGHSATPDLKAAIFGKPNIFNAMELKGFYRGLASEESTLSGVLHGVDALLLSGRYRAAQSGLSSTGAFYRASYSDSSSLLGTMLPIPPDPLLGGYTGVTSEILNANIGSIAPISLLGLVSGIACTALPSTIYGVLQENLLASYFGYESAPLSANYLGTGSGNISLVASMETVKGIEHEEVLLSTISGLVSGYDPLYSSLIGHTPFSLSGTLYGVPPVELYSYINPVPSGVTLSGSILGILPTGALPAYINATGGYEDLSTMIRSAVAGQLNVLGNIIGTGSSQLHAEINSATSNYLQASVNDPLGAPSANQLNASIVPTFYSGISGSYMPVIGNTLGGSLTSIPGAGLYAVINPKVFFIDSTIPINTFPFGDLKAVINTDLCGFSSAFSDLHVHITGVLHKDLTASILAIAGQYAMAHDELGLFLKNKVISEDWVSYIIDQPAITQDELPFVLTTAPVHSLTAIITGLPNNADLAAEITPKYYSNVLRDSKSIVEWVNTKTGERKVVRIYFRGDAVNFYYSDLAGESFSFSPEDHLEIEIQSYDKIEENEQGSLLAAKTSVKRCIVDNLSDFATIDEAIRFGITCAVSEINQELRAIIVAKGAVKQLEADITPLRVDELLDLQAKYFPSSNSPVLSGSIYASGGFEQLHAYISALTPDHTSGRFEDTLGEKYIPKLVVHGNEEVSIVLTKVISTDRISVSSPDLYAEIIGVGQSTLEASVSGSL